ncbi:hypothetical protein G9A89_004397 [Geosiphon pyriformis]|nr:hypothetical protein G9A89_004397 [Geosiphon pyriformis]
MVEILDLENSCYIMEYDSPFFPYTPEVGHINETFVESDHLKTNSATTISKNQNTHLKRKESVKPYKMLERLNKQVQETQERNEKEEIIDVTGSVVDESSQSMHPRINFGNLRKKSLENSRQTSQKKMIVDFTRYFDNQHLSDINFTFKNGKIIYAHRFALVTRSSYFDQIFSNQWVNQTTIQIEAVEFITFRAILYYIYKDDLDSSLPIKTLLDVYGQSTEFDVLELKKMAIQELSGRINSDTWDEIFIFGWKHNEEKVRKIAVQYAVSNWDDAVERKPGKMVKILESSGVKAIEELICAKYSLR